LGVLDAHEPLLVGVDQEQTAEGPERLSAQVGLGFLVQEQYLAPRGGQFGRRDQTGEATATTIASASADPAANAGNACAARAAPATTPPATVRALRLLITVGDAEFSMRCLPEEVREVREVRQTHEGVPGHFCCYRR
jgi:hypothetical protein